MTESRNQGGFTDEALEVLKALAIAALVSFIKWMLGRLSPARKKATKSADPVK